MGFSQNFSNFLSLKRCAWKSYSIHFISLRAGLHFDKICSWLLLSFNESYINCTGDLMRLDTPAWGPLVQEWAELLLAVKQNQHFLSHSQYQWTVLRHGQGLSYLHPLWWAQATANGQILNKIANFLQKFLALAKAKHKKGRMCHFISSHHPSCHALTSSLHFCSNASTKSLSDDMSHSYFTSDEPTLVSYMLPLFLTNVAIVALIVPTS